MNKASKPLMNHLFRGAYVKVLLTVIYAIAVALGTYNWNLATDLENECEDNLVRGQEELRYTRIYVAIQRTHRSVIEMSLAGPESAEQRRIRLDLENAEKDIAKSLNDMENAQGTFEAFCDEANALVWKALVIVLIAGAILTILTTDTAKAPYRTGKIKRKRAMRLRLEKRKNDH